MQGALLQGELLACLIAFGIAAVFLAVVADTFTYVSVSRQIVLLLW